MGRSITYRQIFTLDLEHGYYRGRIARALRLEPSAETRRLFDFFSLRIEAMPGRIAIWRGLEAGRTEASIPATAAFAFAVVSDDPAFMDVTQPDWTAAQGTGAWRLHMSNKSVAAADAQVLLSKDFAALPVTRAAPVAPGRIAPETPLRLSRWWSGEDIWEGLAPAAGQTLATPPLEDGRYSVATDDAPFDFLRLDRRPDGVVGLLELGLPRAAAAPAAGRLKFEARTAIWDYVIRSRDPDLPLDRCRVVSRDGSLVFDAPAPAPGEAGAWLFSSPEKLPLALAEAPAAESRLQLEIPPYGLKTPDPAPLPAEGPQGLCTQAGKTRCVLRVTV